VAEPLSYQQRAERGLAGKPGAQGAQPPAGGRPKIDWTGKGSASDPDAAEKAREAALEKEARRLERETRARGRESMRTARKQARQAPRDGAGKQAGKRTGGGVLEGIEDAPGTPVLGGIAGKGASKAKAAGAARARREGRRAWRESGIPSATRTWSGIGYQIAGASIGLALLLLFVSGRGPSTATGLFGMLARLVDLIVSPVDPLAAGTTGRLVGDQGIAPPTYSPVDQAALDLAGTQGFATGHPGGPSLNRRPRRRQAVIPGHKRHSRG
jgi:hypothetical protein